MCNEKDETAQKIVSEWKKLVQLWHEHKRRHYNVATFVKKSVKNRLDRLQVDANTKALMALIRQWQLEENT